MLFSDFRQKEVIDITSGERLGFVSDVEFSEGDGALAGILLPGAGRFFGLLASRDSLFVPWENIEKIGDDIVLVRLSSVSFQAKKELPSASSLRDYSPKNHDFGT